MFMVTPGAPTRRVLLYTSPQLVANSGKIGILGRAIVPAYPGTGFSGPRTRFERVTFAFGGLRGPQTSPPGRYQAVAHDRPIS